MTIQISDHFTYRKLIRFTIPSIIMMIFTSIYGVVDGIWYAVIMAELLALVVTVGFLVTKKGKYQY